MRKLFGKLGRWRRISPSSSFSTSTTPFAIPCACGRVATGKRKPEYQVIACPSCRKELFVLPVSPLPKLLPASVDLPSEDPTPPPPARDQRRNLFRLLTVIAAAFVLLALLFQFAASFLWPVVSHNDQPASLQTLRKKALKHWRQAKEQIMRGHFASARERLNQLARLPPPARDEIIEAGKLSHLRKEVALYNDLIESSLEELLAQAIDVPETEWQRRFQQRYLGKAIIFDIQVSRREDGAFHSSYVLRVHGQQCHMNLSKIPYLAQLQTGRLQRVLFGARLAAIARRSAGVWVVQLQPGSFTLLTDSDALAVCCPPLTDASTATILDHQRKQISAPNPK